jgi:hypothetical protein
MDSGQVRKSRVTKLHAPVPDLSVWNVAKGQCQGRRVYSCDTVELRPVLLPYPWPG